jgi:protein-disulfide isomerase
VRSRELARILAVVGGALVVVIALVVANQVRHHSRNSNPKIVEQVLHGIPQQGIYLGSPKAPLTMVEFADPQCPWCGVWARDAFPTLVKKYVRTGKLRLEYRGLAFVGTDSERLLRLALAAAPQNKLWNVVELEYEDQGAENSGYATDPFMKKIVSSVPGLDANRVLSTWNTSAVVPLINSAEMLAQQSLSKITTPSFLLGPTGAEPTQGIIGTIDVQSFVNAIEAQLQK